MTRTEARRPSRRAFVTGLAGFTGRYMAQRLAAAGYDVWGTVAPGAARLDDPALAHCTLLPVDLLDADATRAALADARPDAVVHLAARAHVAQDEPSQTYAVNIVGTRNLLAALAGLDRRPSAVLLASSANIYGNSTAGVLDESVAPAPANDYAVSKLAMEYAAKLWADRLPIVIARPFNYTGVGQDDAYLLPKLVSHYARNAPRISLGNLDVSRDFSDVRDVTAAYLKLLEAAPAGETFNICSERAYSLKEVLAMLSRIAGYVIDVTIDPRFVRHNEVKSLSGSRDKLRRAVGELPVTPLDETLRWMMDAMRDARAG
ncbi:MULTISPECIES: NAD-dependent epimerase/dehydratase family protein [unclassified Burkholderia]|uniref:NAD-dependent epimerase/dehydratase family protein n=1 Tax=unclassified Burkholderia TaxID=2613784 RepID=UPI000F55DCA2|nr:MULTISPECIES: NAD-dependent epimerase/dehydratase family protein [unclassified Burkholderia]RQR84015.1 NAD-dependent epimerase/dehydratase family protein [Burkholderia sp. Bp9011]RQR94227.1 NAD-dependent epimerase/dehydratase family protein [Burkholderia sp. Bp9010]RQS11702.1 NAD-dependent epimerase/dehydratase family protein [Burkholderia sp. Bp8991]RQS61999.1 NAD-dependent epimerase/dehydratase family protein [Burkholderia sp. Bp8984]RQS79373.1 NAD-dependent epimerase/dehydratase family p